METCNYKYAGIHLSGSSAHRSCIVILRGHLNHGPLVLDAMHDRIGPVGRVFSDDRMSEILDLHAPIAQVFVDCPISSPPCVACVRPSCPGVNACEEMEVAYMLSMAARIPKGPRGRRRSINPQVQRLWDIARLADGGPPGQGTYSANMAPLVVRAQSLQRRLNHFTSRIRLKETSVPVALSALNRAMGLDPYVELRYRKFGTGAEVRNQIVSKMEDLGWIAEIEEDLRRELVSSIECFQALVTALVGGLVEDSRYEPVPDQVESGWVYIPCVEN